jgi:DNA helicase-2/ATP-dependent DNA helicase PcrA
VQPTSYRIIGLPGTGKTYKLLLMLEEFIKKGYRMHRIAFCSHTKTAITEIKQRIAKQMQHYSLDRMTYVKTMHGICYMLLMHSSKVKRTILTGKKRLKTQISFFKLFTSQFITDYPYEDTFDGSGSYNVIKLNGKIIFQYITYLYTNHPDDLSSQIDLEKVVEEKVKKHNGVVEDMDSLVELIIETLHRWEEYKKNNDLIEFTNMLYEAYRKKLVPSIDVLIIDEFQDLSPIQFRIFELWSKHVKQVVIAGDPNQAIFSFQGATPEFINTFQPDHDILLNESYRVPQEVINYTQSLMDGTPWISVMKPHLSVTNNVGKGSVERLDSWKELQIRLNGQRTFILTRTRRVLDIVKEELSKLGILYQGGVNQSNSYVDQKRITQLIRKLQNEIPLQRDEVRYVLQLEALSEHKDLFDPNYRDELSRWASYHSKKRELFDLPVGDLMYHNIFMVCTVFEDKQEVINFITNNITLPNLRSYAHLITQGYSPQKIQNLSSGIELKTIHQAKGEEADTIILVNAATYYEINDLHDHDEERRIWYVGLTRARQEVLILPLPNNNLMEGKKTKYLVDYSL